MYLGQNHKRLKFHILGFGPFSSKYITLLLTYNNLICELNNTDTILTKSQQ